MIHPRDHYKNKVVCVTGAGGSIGSEICRRLIEYGVKHLVMLGHSEMPLYTVEKELAALNATTALGSICDAQFIEFLFSSSKVDIVINAAAHKHVPLCEQAPFEAISNNIGGAITLAQAAARWGVGQFIQVSSDKAVKPASVMGMTKRVCELYLNFLSARSSMKISTVRFGNVLDSSGSVLPLWREQLAQGKPITLTDKRCTRFFMSIPEAVDLTLGVGSLKPGLYVLDMGEPKNLYDLACEVLEEAGKRKIPGAYPDDFIKFTGLRPGEKLTEELSYGGELVKTKLPKVLAVREGEGQHIIGWQDFQDLLMAAQCRHQALALGKLKELCR